MQINKMKINKIFNHMCVSPFDSPTCTVVFVLNAHISEVSAQLLFQAPPKSHRERPLPTIILKTSSTMFDRRASNL